MSDGFLSRWSRRKLDAREGRPTPEPPQAPVEPRAEAVAQNPAAPLAPSGSPRPPATVGRDPAAPMPPEPAAPEPPPPSLADALALPAGAEVRAFMARNVAPEVRAAAVKKLFADPHFNMMDGLDIYIDDYSRPSPLPQALLRELQSAEALGLFDAPREDAPDPASAQAVRAASGGPRLDAGLADPPRTEPVPPTDAADPAVPPEPTAASHPQPNDPPKT